MQNLILATLIIISSNSFGAKLKNIEMADSIMIGQEKLVLNGQGLRFVKKLFMTFDVYVGGLYLSKKSQDAQSIINSKDTKKLVLQFLRDVDKDSLTNAWTESFKKNTDEEVFKKVQTALKSLNDYMSDIKEGQQIAMEFLANETRIKFANKNPISIKVELFPQILLSVWLKNPPNEGIKEGLLGK